MANAPAARHALRLLRLLAAHAAPMPASAIARELELPRSTVYHVLSVLREEGFVVHLPAERRYGLGVAAFELGSAYARQEPLRRVAAPALARMVTATGHNGHFAVLHGTDVLYVIEERAPGRPSLVTDVGVRLPAQLTASGLAMLAGLSPAQVGALYPSRAALVLREGRGPRSLTELRRELVRVRQDGFATEQGSVTEGFASVAAAVLDHRGHPVAAVALTYREREVRSPETRAALAASTIRAAGHISRGLIGRADGP
ncbi:IclR family transcriptional regulator [Patulibacter sp. NPDC049589]|uniref:IclR family transcriptional regulator n=1 Tax=Patulibacter sp. NPDC049589 TaxID=3154731 RepID=UPI00341F24B3